MRWYSLMSPFSMPILTYVCASGKTNCLQQANLDPRFSSIHLLILSSWWVGTYFSSLKKSVLESLGSAIVNSIPIYKQTASNHKSIINHSYSYIGVSTCSYLVIIEVFLYYCIFSILAYPYICSDISPFFLHTTNTTIIVKSDKSSKLEQRNGWQLLGLAVRKLNDISFYLQYSF